MQLFLGLALATVPSLIGQESRAIRNMEAMPAESVVSNLIEVGSPKVPSSFSDNVSGLGLLGFNALTISP